MSACNDIELLPAGRQAVKVMCHLLTREHVFPRLNTAWQSLEGLYDLLSAVDNGACRVFVAWDDAGKPLGACWGQLTSDSGWWNHSAFQRGASAVELSLAMANELKATLGATYIASAIAVDNHAANIYARRFGCRCTGRSADGKFNLYRKDI